MPITNHAPSAQIRQNYGTTVASIAALRAVTASERFSNQLVYVADVDRTYEFEPASVGVDDGDLILLPDDSPATGRWEKRGAGVAVPAIHAFGGGQHSADSFANVDSKVSGETLFKQSDIADPGNAGRVKRTGGSTFGTIKDATGEAADPTVDDDTTLGYEVGSIWLNTTNDKAFICLDATDGAAVWLSTTGAGTMLSFQFFADQLDQPVNADWAVNALAPAVADSNNNGLTVRAFDDTAEEGVGFIVRVPAGVTNIILRLKGRAETGPPAARTVGLKLYQRGIPDDAAPEAWTAGLVLTDIDLPTTTEFFQYDEQTITLATLGITAGEITQFELTRIDPAGGTELVGDWNLLQLEVEFT